MPDTFIKIASVTVGSGGAASIDFTSIPSTYTDLIIKATSRNTSTAGAAWNYFKLKPNGLSTNLSYRFVYGVGTSAASDLGTGNLIGGYSNDSSSTANTFGSSDIYIPNYAGSNYKSISSDSVTENNDTSAIAVLSANLWSDTAAITSITLEQATGNFAQYSTFYLYGIKNS